ncbi:hypothetical protein GCM10025882_26780 [Acinetobacter gyllenbergii]|uniref:Uncharacterized protein n=1 Tax=Acinetobacter gyllenbergii CIP 110306 = MTCC 11365 TaxID=1217657 RepID=A0A829HBM9_9GAMM|nr:hypothetical protein [Acinetobacter gyllenbergii]EPF70794.1 hypothetical protein F957_03928 [Acinetobacter gyllenbergii CIP 110306 = MTCC 11365]GMA12253.1 hypothetical protein GCM10025882_26780 [Acinetobacter gyllenbergii]
MKLAETQRKDLAKVVARRDKLRGKYNRSGLSNTDYSELLQLDKTIEQALKVGSNEKY